MSAHLAKHGRTTFFSVSRTTNKKSDKKEKIDQISMDEVVAAMARTTGESPQAIQAFLREKLQLQANLVQFIVTVGRKITPSTRSLPPDDRV